MSQEWPGSLVCGVFRKSYKLLRSYSNHWNVCHSTVFVTQRSNSLFICVFSIRSLYLISYLNSHVVRVRFFEVRDYTTHYVSSVAAVGLSLSVENRTSFWFYISCAYWGVIYPFFLLCHPFVEWCILCCSGIDVLRVRILPYLFMCWSITITEYCLYLLVNCGCAVHVSGILSKHWLKCTLPKRMFID